MSFLPARLKSCPPRSLNSDLGNEAEDVVVEDIVEFAFVFLFEAFAQKFRRDEAGFAISEFAAGFFAKSDKRGVCEADDASVAVIIEKEFSVNGVGVACGDAVPHVREAAVIDLAA